MIFICETRAKLLTLLIRVAELAGGEAEIAALVGKLASPLQACELRCVGGSTTLGQRNWHRYRTPLMKVVKTRMPRWSRTPCHDGVSLSGPPLPVSPLAPLCRSPTPRKRNGSRMMHTPTAHFFTPMAAAEDGETPRPTTNGKAHASFAEAWDAYVDTQEKLRQSTRKEATRSALAWRGPRSVTTKWRSAGGRST